MAASVWTASPRLVTEPVAVITKCRPQLLRVIDLSVEHDPRRAIARSQRLNRGFAQVVDLQLVKADPCRETSGTIRPSLQSAGAAIIANPQERLAVGTTVAQGAVRAAQRRANRGFITPEPNDGANPAHRLRVRGYGRRKMLPLH